MILNVSAKVRVNLRAKPHAYFGVPVRLYLNVPLANISNSSTHSTSLHYLNYDYRSNVFMILKLASVIPVMSNLFKNSSMMNHLLQ